MLALFAVLIGLSLQIKANAQPLQILQIYREPLKPGSELAYREIEEDTARLSAELGCPHPYLGIESLTGPKEVWWSNGYNSSAEQKQVVAAYAKNARFLRSRTTVSEKPTSLERVSKSSHVIVVT